MKYICILLLVILGCEQRKFSETDRKSKTDRKPELALEFARIHRLQPYTCDNGSAILDCQHRLPSGEFVLWHCNYQGCLLGKWVD